MNLPIDPILPELITALKSSGRAVLQAPPGAGKTTRVPLALLDADLFSGKIIMLEPRRLATRAAAERLADQRGERPGVSIGYAMRGDTTTNKSTRIDVVTEGVLTRMIQSDPELSGVSCIIFDEFHERSLTGDLGLALTLEIRSALRSDLNIVVMSATLDAAPVAKLMDDAPILTSQGRAYPVEQKFLDRPWAKPNAHVPRFEHAMADLIETAVRESSGSILAFLPGEGEIRRVEQTLLQRLGKDISIRPLFGTMPFNEQRRAIAPSTERKLVLATSIAETSLTIEDITVVVDGGRARRAVFDRNSGMARLVTQKVTRAEATQRQGRAGRVSQGTCYKLWTKGEDGGLIPFPAPEILSSDLTSIVLELAQWGSHSPSDLPFLTQPRETDFKAAQSLLQSLGALDQHNRITHLGKRIAREPVHPRLARLLIEGSSDAAGLVALLESRDFLNRDAPADLGLRYDAFKDIQKFESERPYSANRSALSRIKSDAKRYRAKGSNNLSLAQMAALAYPDRIGLRRTGDAPRYLLSGGTGAYFEAGDPLGQAQMIVATDLDGAAKEAKVRLAIEIPHSDMLEIFSDQITVQNSCEWSKRDKRVNAVTKTMFGALALSSKPWKDCPNEQTATALCDGISELGLSVLPWNKTAKLFASKVNWLHARGANVPDLQEDMLLNSLHDWLAPHLSNITRIDNLHTLNLTDILQSILTYEEQQTVSRLAPAVYKAPTGTSCAIDYSTEQPKISIRLQELFGVSTHPTIGPDRLPLLIELLSPAQRPVQTTADLVHFWAHSYEDVRKDMRGRYPRHPWPIDPEAAEPTRRVKNPRKR